MSHAAHIANPSFLVYHLPVVPAKKKPAPKTTRGAGVIDGNAIMEVNHKRDSADGESDQGDSDSEKSRDNRGFDFTV